MTEQDIKTRVDNLYMKLNMKKTHRIPIVQVAHQLGLDVYALDDMPSRINGAMYLNIGDEDVLRSSGGNPNIIIINGMLDAEHKRFTVAHEVGHFLLHQNQDDTFLIYHQVEDEEDGIEGEACKFAAMLLMDEDVFKQKFYGLKAAGIVNKKEMVQNLRRIFCVPWRAAERRMQELELTL